MAVWRLLREGFVQISADDQQDYSSKDFVPDDPVKEWITGMDLCIEIGMSTADIEEEKSHPKQFGDNQKYSKKSNADVLGRDKAETIRTDILV